MHHIQRFLKLSLIFTIFMLFSNISYALPFSYNPNATCGDFLRHFDNNAPDYFHYDNCQIDDKAHHGKSIEVSYKIDGHFGKQAEQYLMEKTGIGQLKHVCCYWESKRGEFINPKDKTYYEVVFFSSEETRPKVPWQELTFYLKIRVFREDI